MVAIWDDWCLAISCHFPFQSPSLPCFLWTSDTFWKPTESFFFSMWSSVNYLEVGITRDTPLLPFLTDLPPISH